MDIRELWFMNPFIGAFKHESFVSDRQCESDLVDIVKEIEKDENNSNYQKDDDEMLAYLEEVDPQEV